MILVALDSRHVHSEVNAVNMAWVLFSGHYNANAKMQALINPGGGNEWRPPLHCQSKKKHFSSINTTLSEHCDESAKRQTIINPKGVQDRRSPLYRQSKKQRLSSTNTRLTDGAARKQDVTDKNSAVPTTFSDLNSDCVTVILSFLPSEEMNNVVFCSKHIQAARASHMLDQTRTGTIVCRQDTTLDGFFQTIHQRQWNTTIFNEDSNITHLRVENFNEMDSHYDETLVSFWKVRAELPFITQLNMSIDTIDNRILVERNSLYSLLDICPRLEQLDMSNVGIALRNTDVNGGEDDSFQLVDKCLELKKLVWKHGNYIGLAGLPRERHRSPFLRELILDDSVLPANGLPANTRVTEQRINDSFGCTDPNNRDHPWMMKYGSRKLQSLSLKDVSFVVPSGHMFPVTQRMLVRLVRCTPSLRWLRSDLNPANTAMLKRERPEIIFCN
jgi:hypothetical protein